MTRDLIFIGPLPPPVHGQAIATRTVQEQLLTAGLQIETLNLGVESRGSAAALMVRRGWAQLRAIMACITGRQPSVYISVGANRGMYLTALMALAARATGKTVVLHHHTYAHIGQEVPRMKILLALAGKAAWHITICPAMSAQLKKVYPQVLKTLEFSNIGSVDTGLLTLAREDRTEVTLGFMSNLTAEKGVHHAIAAFREALAAGHAQRLVLAGPCNDEASRQAVEAALEEMGDRLVYLGPVYGHEKVSFFEMIDIFLFPSTYANETQGIVNLEALAAGLPIVAFGLCCIPSDLDVDSCIVVDPHEGPAGFADATRRMAGQLGQQSRHALAQASRAQFGRLQSRHAAERSALYDLLAGVRPEGRTSSAD